MVQSRGSHPYGRVQRVSGVLREVVGETLERLRDEDTRLEFLTVTDVDVKPDLRSATVYFATLPPGARDALEGVRIALQRAIARQMRLKRTPQLTFALDEAFVRAGEIDEILRRQSRR